MYISTHSIVCSCSKFIPNYCLFHSGNKKSINLKFMRFSIMLILLYSLVTLLLFQLSHSATFVVDGVSQWKNPHVQTGDSVIFQHKYHYSLYIFQNKKAFTICNFTQATLLTKPNSTAYTWHISRPGFFYFSFSNGSNGACLQGQKLAAEVSAVPPPKSGASPELPPPVASSMAFPWPSQPREIRSPSQAPGLSLTATGTISPDREGGALINSFPTVPLPTGEVDSVTFRPPTSSAHPHSEKVVGFHGIQRGLSCVMLLLMMV